MFRSALLVCTILVPLIAQTQIEWSSNFDNCYSFSSPRTSDLNNDGVLDVILGAGIDGTPVDNGYIAINGVNGEALWTLPALDQIYGSATFLHIDNDGVSDIILAGRNANLKAINGSTGETIWDFYDDPDVPPGDLNYWNFYNSQTIPDQDGDGIDDILIANGGNAELPIFELDRPPGHIMVISGASGAELAFAEVPDGKETYMSPLILDIDEDGALDVIYGTGGEFIEGSLWRTTLDAVMANDISQSVAILTSESNGFIAPPSLVDLNLDGTIDIVVNAYDGRVVALSGVDNSVIWSIDVPGSETNSSPAIGFFNDDNIPDVFSTYAVGQAPSFSSFIQFMIDGATGEKIWEDALGIFHFSSPLVYDLDGDGVDEVIQSINEMESGEFTNTILAIDFNNSSVNNIIGPNPGVNINATPWIGNLDQDGILDLVTLRSIGTGFTTLEDGIIVEKYSLDGVSDASIVPWGSYMGTNYDGQYTSTQVDCNFTLNINSNNNLCFQGNGGIAAVMSSGCPNPGDCQYLWSNGSTEQLVSNLAAGNYTVSVTHPNGCSLSTEVEITEPSNSPYSLTVVNASCANLSDGSIAIENLDPNFDYDFNWNNGASTETLENLSIGNYTVFFTDQNDCFIQLDANLTSAPPIEFVIDFDNISCFGDSNGYIEIDSLSGLEPLSVIWTGDHIGNELILSDLPQGIYNLEITDGTDCNYIETFEVVDPPDLVLDVSITDLGCTGMDDGSISANIIGGTPPYTITFENNFIGPTFSELFIRSNLPAGNYGLEVRDWNDCSVALNLPVDPALNLETDITPASAFGASDGAVSLSVSQGTPPYSLEFEGATITTFPHLLNNLTGGDSLDFIISDSDGCTINENFVVPFSQSIEDLEESSLLAYPNPTTSVSFVELPLDISCPSYQLFNNAGKPVQNGFYDPNLGLNVSELAKGVYFAVFLCQKTRLNAKLVKF